jgi:hypothetical protein
MATLITETDESVMLGLTGGGGRSNNMLNMTRIAIFRVRSSMQGRGEGKRDSIRKTVKGEYSMSYLF